MKICGEPVNVCTKPPGHEGECAYTDPPLIARGPAPPRPEVRPAPRRKCDVWFYPPDHGPRDGSQVICARHEGHSGHHATEVTVEDLALDLANAMREQVAAVNANVKAHEAAEAACKKTDEAEKVLLAAVKAEQIGRRL